MIVRIDLDVLWLVVWFWAKWGQKSKVKVATRANMVKKGGSIHDCSSSSSIQLLSLNCS